MRGRMLQVLYDHCALLYLIVTWILNFHGKVINIFIKLIYLYFVQMKFIKRLIIHFKLYRAPEFQRILKSQIFLCQMMLGDSIKSHLGKYKDVVLLLAE